MRRAQRSNTKPVRAVANKAFHPICPCHRADSIALSFSFFFAFSKIIREQKIDVEREREKLRHPFSSVPRHDCDSWPSHPANPAAAAAPRKVFFRNALRLTRSAVWDHLERIRCRATGCHSPRPVSRHHENAIKTTYDAFTSEQGPELFPYSPLGFTREESTSRGLVGRLCEAKNAESTSTVERLLKGEPLKNITGLRQFDIFPFLLYLKLDLLYLFFLQSGGKRSYQIF